jgi:hypothetical protein
MEMRSVDTALGTERNRRFLGNAFFGNAFFRNAFFENAFLDL